MRFFILFFLTALASVMFAQKMTDISDTKVREGFRGLSVVNDSVVWVSGTHGHVGLSLNAGKTWNWSVPQGAEKLDFRSIFAFDSKKAVIANAGFPATIYFTEDAGRNWKKVFEKRDSAFFIDGIDFWQNGRGFIFGDPVNGKMLQLATSDSGRTWEDFFEEHSAALKNGEASFAASGTTIRAFGNFQLIIATGGACSRILYSQDGGHNWESFSVPILQGKPSQGIFSVALFGKNMAVVGGDFSSDTLKKNNVFIGKFPGKNWKAPKIPTRGYRSGVEFVNEKMLIATGPGGTDISTDGGKNWKAFSDRGYHAVKKARAGKIVYLSGASGQLAKFSL